MKSFLRRPEVEVRYGVSTSTIYRWASSGRFPAPIKLGPNLVAWRRTDLDTFDADPAAWRAGRRDAMGSNDPVTSLRMLKTL